MAPSIAHDVHARARPFLDLVDAMRKDGVHRSVTIPQIAVMGDQSSGKSSVLEAISGIQFPRGAGLVTRCATQITMSHGPEWSAELHAVGEVRSVKVGEEHELGRHIDELTAKLRGDEEFASVDKLIEIKLEAPDAPDLTIIDLPGIVRTSTAGQTDAVKDQVDKLLLHYLKQSRTIILAVIPCNVDIATVDILERASKVDPKGERTIGVLTKPDLVDRGAESEVPMCCRTAPSRSGMATSCSRTARRSSLRTRR
jgi:interferon-induced GTP-binding protein Mx1